MKLYHGTSEARVKQILSQGIKPRGAGGKHNWEHADMPSHEEAVYLTVAYAPYFAFCATDPDAIPKERLAVLEIDSNRLDQSRLCPDEDFLEQISRTGDRQEAAKLAIQWDYQAVGHPEWADLDMKTRTANYRALMHSEYGHTWNLSVKHLGNCAHMGTIPSSAITRYSLYDALGTDSVFEITSCLVEPTITTLNYQFMGDFYRLYTQWFFGANLTWGEIRNFGSFSEEQDRAMYLHNTRLLDAHKKATDDELNQQYDEMKAASEKSLRNHGGLTVYQRKGKKFVTVSVAMGAQSHRKR